MGSSLQVQRTVAFVETDMAGIVHFSNFFRYFEAAECELFSSLGIPLFHKDEAGVSFGWPRVDANCRFRRPLRFQDGFHVRTEVVNVESMRVRIHNAIHLDSSINQRPIAEGDSLLAYARFGSADDAVEATPIPDNWRRRLLGLANR